MPTLIIGSTAMNIYVPDRVVNDYDAFSDLEGLESPPAGDLFWDDSFYQWLGYTNETRYATLDELYTIKVSHSYWELENGSWNKHIYDIQVLKDHGAQLIPSLHDLLYKVWEQKHGVKRVNLNMDKSEFFADAVRRTYDHDSLHESVAYGDVPMYDAMLPDGQTIAMDMALIKSLSFEDQVKLYREEIYVTALERWVIPSNYTCSPSLAYTLALRKTITSLTKGWSARFIVDNYATFRKADIDYVAWHKSKSHKLIRLDQNV